MSTLTAPAPLPQDVPTFEAFLEKPDDFYERYPRLPGYPVRCTEGCGILLQVEPIEGTRPAQFVAHIDLGNGRGWDTNLSFVRHATWKVAGMHWPALDALSPFALELLGEPGAPLRAAYEQLLAEQAAG